MLLLAALALLPLAPSIAVGAHDTAVAPQSTTVAAQTPGTTAAAQTTTVEAQSSAPAPVTCASTLGAAHAVRGGHLEGRRAAAIDRKRAMPARKDVGLRPDQRVGVGRLQRGVRHRRRGVGGIVEAEAALVTCRTSASCSSTATKARSTSGCSRYARYLNQRNLATSLRRCVRQDPHGAAPPGHPAAEILRAVLGMVPHAEDALLPLRLVVERLARRSGAGGRRRQLELDLQPVRDRGSRHHVAAGGAQHRRTVPVLAGRRRSPDRRRVLPRIVHLRRLAQGRVLHQGQVPWRCSPTT